MIEGVSSRQSLRSIATAGDVTGMKDPGAKAADSAPGTAVASVAQASVGQASLRTTTGTAPPVDAAKVAALREAIASGAYKPDPVAIAERIIAFDAGSKSR